VSNLDGAIATTQQQLADLQKQKREELTAKHREAVKQARTARDTVEELMRQFRQQEPIVQARQQEYNDAIVAISSLDAGLDSLPTDEEVERYEQERPRLNNLAEEKRQAFIAEKNKLEGIRGQVTRADKVYVGLSYVVQNLANRLAGPLEGGVFGVTDGVRLF
jgi:seryl-tRNA synthetase